MNPIIDSITEIHQRLWRPGQDVSSATKLAIKITRDWQAEITKKHPYFIAEYPIEALNEKIDLYDTTNYIAYELKVSQNNTHMEFYRDVFKVIIHNETSRVKIVKLIFISPEDGIVRLQKGLGLAASRIGKKLGFEIVTHGIKQAEVAGGNSAALRALP